MQFRDFSRWLLLILVLLLQTILLSFVIPEEESPLADRILFFEREIDRLRDDLNIPGMSVAIVHEQQVVFARGFGYSDIDREIPTTENTPYNIASCTKTFAAVVIMQLVKSGQLSLDDEMADVLRDADLTFPEFRIDRLQVFLPGATIHGYSDLCRKLKEWGEDGSNPLRFLFQGYHGDTERITVRHHLTHTSQGVPGETYHYNGFLFGLLSSVIEKTSGKSFAESLVDGIISPLAMTRTVPSGNKDRDRQILDERARYYRVDDTGEFVLSGFPVTLNAGGGIISTVLDLAKFDVAMDSNSIISEESKEEMFTQTISNSGQPLPYGKGWFVQEHNGMKLVWHYGWAPDAYSSLMLKVLEEDLTLILLANSDGASAQFDLGAGSVLRSPFAVAFIDLFAGTEPHHQVAS